MRQRNVHGYPLAVPGVGDVAPGEVFDAPDLVTGCAPAAAKPAAKPEDSPPGGDKPQSKPTARKD